MKCPHSHRQSTTISFGARQEWPVCAQQEWPTRRTGFGAVQAHEEQHHPRRRRV